MFLDYAKTLEQFGDISNLDSPTFLPGMRLGEEVEVEIETGKTLIVKLVSIGQLLDDGTRIVYFELNGQLREISVKDENIKSSVIEKIKADPKNNNQIGTTMPGTIIKVIVEKGDQVKQGDHLVITEAIKMETMVQVLFSDMIQNVYVKDGEAISTGNLLLELSK